MARRVNRVLRLSVAMFAVLASVSWLGVPVNFSGTAFAAGFINFEDGTDRAAIKSTIPGLQFTTTNGQDWLYGDWRTGAYNGKYPAGAYTSNGNFFAWLGESQGDGRIDFTQGTASFLSVKVSTLNVVRLRGYDANNNIISQSEFAGGNTGTGRLNDLSIEAPNGQSFSYVIVSGDANYWLIDDLSTDAAGVPGNPGPRPDDDDRDQPADPALISVVERPNPNRVATPSDVDFGLSADAPPSVVDDGIIDYVVLITNRGAGHAKDTLVTMPFDAGALRILDATFSTDAAFVSRIITDTAASALEFHTGPLGPTNTITATIRMLVRPNVPDGASLGQRLTFTWTDGRSGGTGTSNQPLLVAGDADRSEPYYPLVVTPGQGTPSTISATIFAPGEPVSMWYNAPDGRAIAIGTVQADTTGTVAATFDTSALAAGNYTVVAAGAWSQFTAVTSVTIQR